MVAVDHEVRLAELHRDDRRVAAVAECAPERAEPVAAESVQRPEVARERVRAAVRADECVERDRPDSEIPAPKRLQPPLDVVELEQPLCGAGPHAASIVALDSAARIGHVPKESPKIPDKLARWSGCNSGRCRRLRPGT